MNLIIIDDGRLEETRLGDTQIMLQNYLDVADLLLEYQTETKQENKLENLYLIHSPEIQTATDVVKKCKEENLIKVEDEYRRNCGFAKVSYCVFFKEFDFNDNAIDSNKRVKLANNIVDYILSKVGDKNHDKTLVLTDAVLCEPALPEAKIAGLELSKIIVKKLLALNFYVNYYSTRKSDKDVSDHFIKFENDENLSGAFYQKNSISFCYPEAVVFNIRSIVK